MPSRLASITDSLGALFAPLRETRLHSSGRRPRKVVRSEEIVCAHAERGVPGTRVVLEDGREVDVFLGPTALLRRLPDRFARTFVVGEPNDWQLQLLETYREMHEETRAALRPGARVSELDAIGERICARRGLDQYHLKGISHGIGLRFEEIPASTILPAHRSFEIRKNMTVTVGHTVLAIPGCGGVRFEDVCRVTEDGGEILHPYPIDWRPGPVPHEGATRCREAPVRRKEKEDE